MSLFEANSRAIKRVERLKVEVAKKAGGAGKDVFSHTMYEPRRLLDRDWSVALDVVAPYDAALPHQVQLGIRRKETALHALSGLSALAHAQDPAIPSFINVILPMKSVSGADLRRCQLSLRQLSATPHRAGEVS